MPVIDYYASLFTIKLNDYEADGTNYQGELAIRNRLRYNDWHVVLLSSIVRNC